MIANVIHTGVVVYCLDFRASASQLFILISIPWSSYIKDFDDIYSSCAQRLTIGVMQKATYETECTQSFKLSVLNRLNKSAMKFKRPVHVGAKHQQQGHARECKTSTTRSCK